MSLESIKLSELDSKKLKYIRKEKLEKVTFLVSCLKTKNHQAHVDDRRLDTYEAREVLIFLIDSIKLDTSVHENVLAKLENFKTEIEAELKLLENPSVISRQE